MHPLPFNTKHSIITVTHTVGLQVLSCGEESNWMHIAGCGGDDDGHNVAFSAGLSGCPHYICNNTEGYRTTVFRKSKESIYIQGISCIKESKQN